MTYKDFEDYMQTKHAEQAHGVLDDYMPDDYERWISDLAPDDWFIYGERYANLKVKENK